MGDVFSEIPQSLGLPEDRLDSWKEIAAYLNRDVTTVQRWEKREGMPVHRHVHDKKGSVYAFRAELDSWARTRKLPLAVAENHADGPAVLPIATPLRTKWKFILALVGLGATVVIATIIWLQKAEYFWRNPIANARFRGITDWDGTEQAAAISRDGRFVALLSDRDGHMDLWVTQLGSGQFHNLTHGSVTELVNPSIRTLGFSPDSSLVTFWVRKPSASNSTDISTWAVPTLGGQARPYLEGVAEYDWTSDGSWLAYHTPGPGDPLFVSNGSLQPSGKPIFSAPDGLHSHFPLWSPDGKFIYFIQGSLPDSLDIWRIGSRGGTPERITSHNTRVTYPVLLDKNTLMYLATEPDGSGPRLYSMTVDHRVPHRLTPELDRYTSLAASADGRHLVVTVASSKRTLWRLQIGDSPGELSVPAPISLTTSTGFSPRLGPNYLLFLTATDTGVSIWKLASGVATELWRGEGARILGTPAVFSGGRNIAFSVRQNGRALMYAMQDDGTNARVVTDLLDLQGDPAWTTDGKSITTAALDHGIPHLFRVPIDGHSPTVLVNDYSLSPAWAPDGGFALFSGPDVGTTFSVKAVTPEGRPRPLPALTLTRGARHLAFFPGGGSLVMLRGEIQHKNLWLVDLETGAERQLTNLPSDFDIRDFDLSPDGREVVMERVQDRSNVALLDLARP